MITTEGDALLADIIEHPADDALRLIYADWLEDNGESERADFIRAQIFPENSGLAYTLLSGRCAAWAAPLDGWLITGVARTREDLAALDVHFGPRCLMRFRRGFVYLARCTLADWLKHGKAICAAHPIERVELTDKRTAFRGGAFCWWAHWEGLQDTSALDDVGSDIWNCLEKSTKLISPAIGCGWKGYATEALAVDALSKALIKWARRS